MILRSRFEVTGRIRFLSHLDLLKLMERSMRRAGIPVAFSQGFNPHPKIAFGTAKSVGLASICEYFDVELDGKMNPEEFREKLQEVCPEGIVIRETKEILPGEPALMAVLNCASYQVKVRLDHQITHEELDQKIAGLFSRKEIVVQRISPKRKKEFNIRPGIFSITCQFSGPKEILFDMDLSVGNEGNVRPHEVVDALDLGSYHLIDVTRTGLYMRQESGEKTLPS
jgi:radical SAM-linked protein